MRLIALDMDGTLLNRDWQISDVNAKMIRKAQQNGVIAAIASGRAYPDVVKLLAQQELICPVISVNGALIFSREGKLIADAPLPLEQVRQLLTKLTETADRNLYFEVYTNHATLTADTDACRSQPDVRRHVEKTGVKVVQDLAQAVFAEGVQIYKLLVVSFDPGQLAELREQLTANKDLAISSSARDNLEITHVNAQKGLGLQKLADYYGIPIEQTMAVGDNYNDVSMFKTAGVSVAMGNAEEEVKRICTYVTKTNEEHGVAYAIERYALGAGASKG